MNNTQIKNILNDMFIKGQLKQILEYFDECGSLEDEVYDEDGNYKQKECITFFLDCMKRAKKEYGQKNFTLNGHNGVFPFMKAVYHMYEPDMDTYAVNMKEVSHNKVSDAFNLGLYTKLNAGEPAMIVFFSTPRNDSLQAFFWFVD